MTYEEIVSKARELYENVDASDIREHIAYQFNITGEGEGAFYLEINEGRINVQPYEYYDRDVLFTMSADSMIKIATGQLDLIWAYTIGKVGVDGNINKALKLKDLSEKAAKIAEKMLKIEAAKEEKTETPLVKEAQAETVPVAEEAIKTEASVVEEEKAQTAQVAEEVKAEAPVIEEVKAEVSAARKISGKKHQRCRNKRAKR